MFDVYMVLKPKRLPTIAFYSKFRMHQAAMSTWMHCLGHGAGRPTVLQGLSDQALCTHDRVLHGFVHHANHLLRAHCIPQSIASKYQKLVILLRTSGMRGVAIIGGIAT